MIEATVRSLPEVVVAPRTDAIYNCHAYLTKVPVAAILPFIEAFSDRGELVADIFAGSGMTGLAAMMAGRQAALSDISALGQHIARGYLAEVPEEKLVSAGTAVTAAARSRLGDLYRTRRCSDGADVEMSRTVWSFTYTCPACETGLVYYERLSAGGKPPAECPMCGGPFAKRRWKRGVDVPVEVVVAGEDGKLAAQAVGEVDRRAIAAAEVDGRLRDVPSETIGEHREMYGRSGLGKAGLTETARFFSARNAIALLELWRAIGEWDDPSVRRKLRFAFTAILARASRRYQWSAKRPLNAQNQTYYIAPVYYEWNVFELFGRKVRAAVHADRLIFGAGELPGLGRGTPSDVTYDLASADAVGHLPNGSVDYVFTDPPFGSNIFYSDMSLFHEAWLGRTTDDEREAVLHTTGRRKSGAEERYAALLRGAFAEAHRVLKPQRCMSVVFGNSNGRIWGLVQRALRAAGFTSPPVHVAILDKGQRSVKGLNSGSERVVTVDLVLTVRKEGGTDHPGGGRSLSNEDAERLVREAVAEMSEAKARNPSYVYANILTRAIRDGLLLDGLHLGDVLVALRKAGYRVDGNTGELLDGGLETYR